jgi:YVTN family beta-propeller protein
MFMRFAKKVATFATKDAITCFPGTRGNSIRKIPLCAIGVLLAAAVVCPAQPFVYVTNPTANTVTVLSSSTNTIVGTITVCNNPEEVAINPAGTRAYVPCGTFGTQGTVAVIDTSTNSVITTVTSGLGNFSRGVAVSPDGTRIYVTSIDSNTVGVIDASSNVLVSTISGFSFPVGVAFSPDGTRAYVSNGHANTLSVIDTATLSFTATIAGLGNFPHNIGVSPDGTKVYVGSDSGIVSVIDAATNTLMSSIEPVGASHPSWPALSPDGTRLYVSDYGQNNVVVIDTSTNAVISEIPVGGEPYGVAVSGSRVYVACNSSGNPAANGLWVIDTATNTVFTSVLFPSGAGAFGIALKVSPHYGVCLLYDPTKAVHSGATLPIKLQLCDANGNDLSSSSVILHATGITQTSTSISGTVENSGNSNPDNDFRFDSTLGSTGGYIFNLKTTGLTTGTYNLNFTVSGDSFVYAASFQVK